MSRDKENSIQTFSGKRAYPLDPLPEDFFIEDIAHALSMQVRWTGHCIRFISVAEHSVRVSREVERLGFPQFALEGLLHDGGEAYLQDMARPVKSHPDMKFFKLAEEKIQKAISERFGLTFPFPDIVHKADNVLLVTEKRDLMGPLAWSREDRKALGVMALPTRIHPWSQEKAEQKFLDRFTELEERR